MTFHNTAGSG